MFKIEMSTDNTAFGDTRESQAAEVARILEGIAAKLRGDAWARSGLHQTIFDLNGNDVGRFIIKPSAALEKQERDQDNATRLAAQDERLRAYRERMAASVCERNRERIGQ